MRRLIPARVEPRSRRLAFETLESRDLLAADVGVDWWAEPVVFGSADDWSWTFDDSWAGDKGVDQAWDEGWWVDDVSWHDESWDPADASGCVEACSDQIGGDAGWILEDTAAAPDEPPVAVVDVVTGPLDGPETTVVVAAPDGGAAAEPADLPEQIVDVAVPPPAFEFEDFVILGDPVMSEMPADPVGESGDAAEVWEPVVVGITDDADVTTTDVTAEMISADAPDPVFDAAVDDDATEWWVFDATPSEDPADDALPGSGMVDTREDLPVEVTSLGVDPVPFRPVPVAGSTPTFRERTTTAFSTTAAPAARFAGWGAFFMQSFGRAGGTFDGAASGGQVDGQSGSGKPRIRLAFRPVI